MSKGTVRLPESAISGNRIGTARIRDQVASAAAQLASRAPAALDSALGRMVALAPSPVERMQQLGRLGVGKKNKTEQAYDELLSARLQSGEILWYRFEAVKLRLADNTFYTPDFLVITATGTQECHEVKGRWTDDARVKIKVAASQYPFRFIAIRRAGRHDWHIEDLTSSGW